MTEQEKFQKTFDKLHASPETLTEVLNMVEEKKSSTLRKKVRKTGILAAAIAIILVLGSGIAVYAMDIGGIKRQVQIWMKGDQTDVEFTAENGSYSYKYTDQNGEVIEGGGGGVAIDFFGRERQLTDEELLEEFLTPQPDVRYEEDGTVWVYYKDQKIEITDKFEDEVCYVKIDGDDGPIYMTISYQEGWSTSPHKYLEP